MSESLLSEIGKCILGAAVFGLPAYFLGIPLILAYILAGVFLGPHLGLGLVKSNESIATVSEIGLVLLMFILGLEIDLRKLLQAGKAVLVNGFTQFVGCAVLAFLFFSQLGFSKIAGPYGIVYLSFAASLSSTLIVVKILSDRMELDSFISRITLGVLVIQDLWAIGFLAIQPNLDHLSALAIGISFLKAILMVVVSWLCARFILPLIFLKAGKQPELMLVTAMAWCFAICGLADLLHLSLEMGALVAGVAIASYPYHSDVAAKLTSLRDFFITLFFVSLGLQIPSPNKEVLTMSGAIIVFVLSSRILTVFPVLHFMRFGNRASLLPAINLSQVSEFALVLTALGVSYGHVSTDLLSAFTIAMVVTALLSSVSISGGHRIYKVINPLLEKLAIKDHIGKVEKIAEKIPPQIVLLGFFREASSLLHELLTRYSKSAMDKVLVIDFNPEAHHKLKELGIHCHYGDISNMDTLKSFGLENAKLFVCTLPDQQLKGINNHKLLKNLKKLAPKARIIVTAEKLESATEMYNEGADYVYVPRLIGAFYLADVIERLQSEKPLNISLGGASFLKNRKEIIP